MPEAASEQSPEQPPICKVGLIAIVGRANAGKSSLLNALVGEPVAIVSPVAQTTRRPIRAVLTEGDTQLVFTDTPGIRQATHALGSVLNRTARGLVTGSNAACLVVDASMPPRQEDAGWMARLARDEVPVFALLNKMDLRLKEKAYREEWDRVVQELQAKDPDLKPPPVVWLPVSAKTGEGLPELLEKLLATAEPGEAMYAADTLTDDPRPFFVADVIRAQINARLQAELPHACAVEVQSIVDGEEAVRVNAVIYVEKNSQRPIVIGQKAREIRAIRRAAEHELGEIYEIPHKLELWVKVEPNWSRNYWMLRRLGYLPG